SRTMNCLLEQMPKFVLGLSCRVRGPRRNPRRRNRCSELFGSYSHNGHFSHYGQSGQLSRERPLIGHPELPAGGIVAGAGHASSVGRKFSGVLPEAPTTTV